MSLMDQTDMVVIGKAAIRAGAPDFRSNTKQDNLVDTLANMMHAARALGLAWEQAVHDAREHFEAELNGS